MRLDDTDDLAVMQGDDRFVEVFGHRSTPERVRASVEANVETWERLGYGLWTIRDGATGELIGRGGLRPVTILEADEVELGYALRPEWWGRGLATEMSRVALHMAFERL